MSKDSNSIDLNELEWIRLRKEILNEDPIDIESKFMRKFKENPFIPIGVLATTGCLTLGIWNLAKKRSHKQQFYMRARVLAQGLTVAALVMGIGAGAIRKN